MKLKLMKIQGGRYDSPSAEKIEIRTELGFAASDVVVGGDIDPDEEDIDWK